MYDYTKYAFPSQTQDGLTKREYFAAKIMAAEMGRTYHDHDDHEMLAKRSLHAADALIEALKRS